jgi:ketosteroid isomerase-like protein
MTESEVLSVIRAQEQAIARGDAPAVIDPMAEDVVVFDLPPPLVYRADAARDVEELMRWLDSWQDGVSVQLHDPQVIIDGSLAVVLGLSRMMGTKVDGTQVDSWSRRTVVLKRMAGGWKIVHDHLSFPLAMDGTNRAVTDLRP